MVLNTTKISPKEEATNRRHFPLFKDTANLLLLAVLQSRLQGIIKNLSFRASPFIPNIFAHFHKLHILVRKFFIIIDRKTSHISLILK